MVKETAEKVRRKFGVNFVAFSTLDRLPSRAARTRTFYAATAGKSAPERQDDDLFLAAHSDLADRPSPATLPRSPCKAPAKTRPAIRNVPAANRCTGCGNDIIRQRSPAIYNGCDVRSSC